ncbi:hypothetical protein ACGFT2_01880 [Streptomyces sp. NPDC048514]|uniref:hypothetical protein n=1 Tax=Streptomyces sp. NPDC048514 TaxID=3365564 RepID=UPI00371CFE86
MGQSLRRDIREGSWFVVVHDQPGQRGDETEGREPLGARYEPARQVCGTSVCEGQGALLEGGQRLRDIV